MFHYLREMFFKKYIYIYRGFEIYTSQKDLCQSFVNTVVWFKFDVWSDRIITQD